MTDDSVLKLMAEYDLKCELYGAFAARLEQLLRDLLTANGIAVHHVTHRCKSRVSFEKKVRKPEAAYQSAAAVTDIAGIRITTFFAEDVDRVAKLIEAEFEVDVRNTTDKRALIDPDRFGYLSLHHVVSLRKNRAGLTEYRRFPDLKAEIQTRSTLQHAWAEIEHDLGYKTTIELPRHLRRRFSRVAGLLELADQEFNEIRKELKTYEASVGQQIERESTDLLLDKASYIAFVRLDPIVREVDEELLRLNNQQRFGAFSFRQEEIARLKRVGVETIKNLRDNLRKHRDLIVTFAALWLERKTGDDDEDEPDVMFDPGISIFYLWYILTAQLREHAAIEAVLRDSRFSNPEEMARMLVSTFESAERALE